MGLGHKKPHSNRIGLKKMAHTSMRLGLKASDIAMAAAPVAALLGPEAVPVAAANGRHTDRDLSSVENYV